MTHFLGFDTIEQLIPEFPAGSVFRVGLEVETSRHLGNMVRCYIVNVQGIAAAGDVHYVRTRIGRQHITHQDDAGMQARLQRTSNDVVNAFSHFLSELGYHVRPGYVAQPKDLKTIEGSGGSFLSVDVGGWIYIDEETLQSAIRTALAARAQAQAVAS